MQPVSTTHNPILTNLAERISGAVITADDGRYSGGRRLWNAAIDHRPVAIVQPRSAAEVAIAVLAARGAGLEIAVRCGGHSVAGHSMAQGGVTIDLSAMNQVAVDRETRRARVGGGALLIDAANAASAGLVAPCFGHVSHTGVGGLTLGGGLTYVMRRHGLAIDGLRSAQLVTAEGEIVSASEEENSELFWALRGGGGNFGVVTELEFELYPLGPELFAGMMVHPLERAGEVLRFTREFMDQAPRELTLFETFMTVPPVEPFPPELRGRPALGLALCYAGPLAEGEAAVRPLIELGPAVANIGPMPYVAVQTMLDETAPHGMRAYNKAHWLAELPNQAIDALVERHAAVPSPMSLIITARMGGAVQDVPAGATAFAHRGAYRLLWAVSQWWEGDDEEQVAWCRGVFDAMSPYSTGGVYVNALGDEGQARVRASYDDEIWRRLVAVKDRFDPENVFHLNHNIPPSGALG